MEVIMEDIMVVVMFIFTMRIISTTTIIQEINRIPLPITKPTEITAVTGHQRGSQAEHLQQTGLQHLLRPVKQAVHLLRIVLPHHHQPVSQVVHLHQTGHPPHLQTVSRVEFLLPIDHLHQWEHPEPEVAEAEVSAEAAV